MDYLSMVDATVHPGLYPVVTAQRQATAAYQPPSLTRRVMEHNSFYVRAASATSSTVSESGDTTTRGCKPKTQIFPARVSFRFTMLGVARFVPFQPRFDRDCRQKLSVIGFNYGKFWRATSETGFTEFSGVWA